MERGYLVGSCAAVLCALCASACGGSASKLRPGAITKDKGAIFGRVLVVNKGKDITGDCDVNFGGDPKARTAEPDPPPGSGDSSGGRFASSAGAPRGAGSSSVSLDEAGWIFTTHTAGKAYLKQVSCSLGGLAKTPLYTGSELGFIVEGGDRMAYFGIIVVESHHEEQSDSVARSVLLASVGGLVGAAGRPRRAGDGEARRVRGDRPRDLAGRERGRGDVEHARGAVQQALPELRCDARHPGPAPARSDRRLHRRIKACFDAGRARRGVAWSWPGGRFVSMSLHGGARGDAPWLGVLYGTATQPDGKR